MSSPVGTGWPQTWRLTSKVRRDESASLPFVDEVSEKLVVVCSERGSHVWVARVLLRERHIDSVKLVFMCPLSDISDQLVQDPVDLYQIGCEI